MQPFPMLPAALQPLKTLKTGGLVWVCLAWLAASAPASAATIFYPGDCEDLANGGTVVYSDISESGDDAPLYFAPDCSVDTIDFDPQGFVASNDPGPGFDSIDGQLNFTIRSTDGNFIDTLEFHEEGDYTLLGNAPSDTEANVTMIIRVEITALDTGAVFLQDTQNFSQSFTIPDDFSFGTSWSFDQTVDIAQIVLDACNSGLDLACGALAVEIDVQIDNILGTRADADEVARINKKDLNGLTVTVVPEPTTAALLALGLVGIGFRSRAAQRRA